jgi:hypothetical protein
VATLNIDGRSVTVDDAFLSLPHDQQNATVEEIAKSFAPQPKLSDAVTDIPSEVGKAASENIDTIKKGITDRGTKGPIEGLMDTGKAVLAIPGLLASPLTGAARSLIGHPMAQAEHAVGTLINPDVAAKDDPQKMYAAAKGDVDTAMSALASRGVPAIPAGGAQPLTRVVINGGEGQQVAAAAQRLADAGVPVDVPRAIASDSSAVQRLGQGIRNVPIVGDAIPRATLKLVDDLGAANRTVADQYGSGSGPNVASRVGSTIAGAADAETSAATNAARLSDEAVTAAHERAGQQANQSLDAADTNALHQARAAVGDMSPQDMGQTLITRLRAGEQEARSNKERLYGIAGESDGAVHYDAVRGLRKDVTRSLDNDGIVIDPVLTPAAERMLKELDNTSTIRMQRSPDAPLVQPSPAAPSETRAAGARAASTESVAGAAGKPSLLEFLAQKGGLGPDPELEAIGGHTHTVNVEGVGRRKLVKQGGLPLDYAREAAEEAGYLRGDHRGTSTTNDLLDAIDSEIRGRKLYPEGFEGTVSKRESVARSEREQHELDQHTRGLEDDLAAAGHTNLSPGVKDRAIRLMSDERMTADEAVGTAQRELEHQDNALYAGNIRGAPVDMQVLEQTRKRLNFLSRTAQTDGDRRAARQVIRGYDDWLGNAFDNALFSGSDEALQSYRAARAANTEWRQRFGFNERDDADRVVNRIVTGETTPQEAANYIVGAGKVGAKGVSSRLLTRIAEATGNDPEAMQAIRGGIWNRLSQATGGVEAKPSAKVANDIGEFLNGSGRDVAQRLFSPEQQNIMRAYADTLRRTAAGREHVSEVLANTRPGKTNVGVGPMQELANAVLGKGGKTDEALFSAIDSYAKSGGRGDIQTLSQIVQSIPLKDRGDLAGSIVRNLGISPRTRDFSPDMFVSQWQSYTPQAKDILFGNAGPYRRALDDIALVSQRLKQIGQRFGNPAGTAQNVGAAGLGVAAASALSHALYGNFIPALTLMSGVTGGAIAAKILASPAGAASAAKWSNAYAALVTAPKAQTIGAFQVASRNLANTARMLGSSVTPDDFLRAIQSPAQGQSSSQSGRPGE